MYDYKIVTDSTADLPKEYREKYELGCLFLPYTIDGVTYTEKEELDVKTFYDKMRLGMMPTTSQVNPNEAREYFEGWLKESKNILYLAFSSGLSGTYNSARMAAEELMEERGDCNIIVLDTKCASLGEGLLVHKAVMLREEGKSIQETAKWVEDNLLHLVHIFTVDDLNHLYRGGRVSKSAAMIGTIAGIKPILHVDNEGHLIALDKTRGRKKSLRELVDYMQTHMGSFADKNDIVFISHGDALEDAQSVREDIRNRFGIDSFIINTIGPTIGAHSGQGTIALFFMGDSR